MAYIVMLYIVMAYIVMADIVMAYIVMADIVMADIVMAYIVMAGLPVFHAPSCAEQHGALRQMLFSLLMSFIAAECLSPALLVRVRIPTQMCGGARVGGPAYGRAHTHAQPFVCAMCIHLKICFV